MALYAPAIFFDSLLQKSVLDVFFVCLALWLMSRTEETAASAWVDKLTMSARPEPVEGRSPRFLVYGALGLTMGGLALTRENALVLPVVILGWTLAPVRGRPPLGVRATTAAAFVCGLALLLVPVALRNHIVGGGFSLTTSQFGPNFFIGNNPRADGTYMPLRFGRGAPEYERRDAVELAEQAVGKSLTPAEVSGYWSDRALDFITAEPGRWVALMGRKLVLLGNRTEVLDTESQETYAAWSWPLRFGAWIGNFGVLVPLAVLGLWLTWPERRRLVVIYATMAAYGASVVMFYVFARYRFPLVPLLVLFASAGIVSLRRFVRTERFRMKAAVLASIAAVAFGANWPVLSAETLEAVSETNLAVALQEQGRLDEALAHYRRAVAIKADYAPAFNNMGVALQAKGELAQAVATYQRAIALKPDFPDAHTNLGIALMAGGKPDEAVAEFRHALDLDPQSARGHRNLAEALARRNRQDEAIDHFRTAAQLDPGNGAFHYDLASILLEAGRLPEAVDEFRAAVALTPNPSAAHNNLGIALGSEGKLDEAIDQFQQALRLDPQFAEARNNLTLALEARERPVRSLR
jgi:tetratricopeptide (TPR) repeat protein